MKRVIYLYLLALFLIPHSAFGEDQTKGKKRNFAISRKGLVYLTAASWTLSAFLWVLLQMKNKKIKDLEQPHFDKINRPQSMAFSGDNSRPASYSSTQGGTYPTPDMLKTLGFPAQTNPTQSATEHPE